MVFANIKNIKKKFKGDFVNYSRILWVSQNNSAVKNTFIS